MEPLRDKLHIVMESSDSSTWLDIPELALGGNRTANVPSRVPLGIDTLTERQSKESPF